MFCHNIVQAQTSFATCPTDPVILAWRPVGMEFGLCFGGFQEASPELLSDVVALGYGAVGLGCWVCGCGLLAVIIAACVPALKRPEASELFEEMLLTAL